MTPGEEKRNLKINGNGSGVPLLINPPGADGDILVCGNSSYCRLRAE
jgi:hypothetical protein